MAPRPSSSSARTVLILGAGIAGLSAARALAERGFLVQILEGASRIGGRVWTYHFGHGPDAPYGEAGAMRIPRNHRRALGLIAELGLKGQLRPFITFLENENALLRMHGRTYRISESHRAVTQQLAGGKYRVRTRLLAGWLQLLVDATSPSSLRTSWRACLAAKVLKELEARDLRPFVNCDTRHVDLHGFVDAFPEFRGWLSEALAQFFEDILDETRPGLLRLEGGMEQLAIRLAAPVRGRVSLKREVVALKARADGVSVWARGGGMVTEYRADAAICTLPFSVLRHLHLEGLDDDKRRLVHEMVYCRAIKMLFHCARPFWRERGITGGASYSDEYIRQVYYPSAETGAGAAVLLASYTIGDDAEILAQMPEPDRIACVRRGIAALHPVIDEPGMLIAAASIDWGAHKWCRGGCSIPWGRSSTKHTPGDREPPNRALVEQRDQAARHQGRLFFAGEHCSLHPAWIEGALESADAAVRAVAAVGR